MDEETDQMNQEEVVDEELDMGGTPKNPAADDLEEEEDGEEELM